jgi:hypothetical protein
MAVSACLRESGKWFRGTHELFRGARAMKHWAKNISDISWIRGRTELDRRVVQKRTASLGIWVFDCDSRVQCASATHRCGAVVFVGEPL